MKKIFPDRVATYLTKHFQKRFELEWFEVAGIDTVIVVPAISEFENIKSLLNSLSKNSQISLQKSVVIFVVNNSVSSSLDVKADNKKSINYLRYLISKNPPDNSSKRIIDSGISIGLIDASSEGKELEEDNAGVGMARKIGMDKSLEIFDYSITSKKIIISLDADCLVAENYISEIQNYFEQQNCSAAVIDFEHILPEEEIAKTGILSYEIFLRHYVAGLLFANSPFAFHTVGSTIVCDYEAYLKVEGMNTKKAAEDFYFLQKLAKNFRIHRITNIKVNLSPRESWRVPFGTGRSMADFLSNKKIILLYDTDIYFILKEWLSLFNSDLSQNPESILTEAKKIHPSLYNFLGIRNFYKTWQKILSNTNSVRQLDYQKKNWFDAFETLKLVHHLRDSSFPMKDIKNGVEKLFKVIQHSTKFDSTSTTISNENLYKLYLSELKEVENILYTKFNV